MILKVPKILEIIKYHSQHPNPPPQPQFIYKCRHWLPMTFPRPHLHFVIFKTNSIYSVLKDFYLKFFILFSGTSFYGSTLFLSSPPSPWDCWCVMFKATPLFFPFFMYSLLSNYADYRAGLEFPSSTYHGHQHQEPNWGRADCLWEVGIPLLEHPVLLLLTFGYRFICHSPSPCIEQKNSPNLLQFMSFIGGGGCYSDMGHIPDPQKGETRITC